MAGEREDATASESLKDVVEEVPHFFETILALHI
jgi:hypothetical protein